MSINTEVHCPKCGSPIRPFDGHRCPIVELESFSHYPYPWGSVTPAPDWRSIPGEFTVKIDGKPMPVIMFDPFEQTVEALRAEDV